MQENLFTCLLAVGLCFKFSKHFFFFYGISPQWFCGVWDCKCPEERIHKSDVVLSLLLSEVCFMFLFYTFNTSSDPKNPISIYLCTCFNISQYLVSWNMLQQTHDHKENSMHPPKKKRGKKKQNIQKLYTVAFVLPITKWCGFVAGILFVCFFFPPETLQLSSGLCFLILKKLLDSAWLFITYQPCNCTQTSFPTILVWFYYHIKLKYYKFTLLIFTPMGCEVNLKKIMNLLTALLYQKVIFLTEILAFLPFKYFLF